MRIRAAVTTTDDARGTVRVAPSQLGTLTLGGAVEQYSDSMRRVLSVDLRALAAFRIAIGGLLLVDVLTRLGDLRAHYTDFGVLPIGPYVAQLSSPLYISLHFANGTTGWQLFLFALTALVGLCVMVGYRTRFATVAAWVLVVSLHNRNYLVLNGGDVLLRMLYFWGMFLPLGERYSIDAALATGPRRVENAWFGGASAGLVLQVAVLYLCTGILKNGREWWPEGNATLYALSHQEFADGFGRWLTHWPGLLRASTYVVYFLELGAAFLILCPLYHTWLRTVAVVSLVALHLGIGVSMRLGSFPWIDIASLIPLLPGAICDRIAARWSRAERAGLGDRLHDVVARCRVALGPLVERILPYRERGRWEPSLAAQVITVFFIGYIGLWNLKGLPDSEVTMPPTWAKLAQVLRLDQRWAMFSPQPSREGGWFVIPGELKDGTQVDVLRRLERPVDFSLPKDVFETYANIRWRKYLTNLRDRNLKEHRLYYGKWLCRSWNEHRNEAKKLASFDIVFMRMRSVLPGQEGTPERQVFWHHECFKRASNP
jgi:hypothetical protein